MRKFFIFLSVFVITLTSIAWSVDFPLGDLPKDEGRPPNPLELTANWWAYFADNPATLEEKIHETEKIFQVLQKELPERKQVEASTLFDQFVAGLKQLETIKVLPAKAPVYQPALLDQYTYTEWVALGEKFYTQKLQREKLEIEINLGKLSRKANNRAYDRRLSAYLTTNPPLDVRLIDGLTLMSRKVLIEVEQARLENLLNAVEPQDERIHTLRLEIEHAQERIDYASAPLEEITNELTAKKDQMEQLNTQLTTLLKEDIDQLAHMLFSAEQMQKRLEIISLSAQKLLIRLGRNEDLSDEEIRSKLQAWREEVEVITTESQEWIKEADLLLDTVLREGSMPRSEVYATRLAKVQDLLIDVHSFEKTLFMNDFFLDQLTISARESRAISGFFYSFWDRLHDFFIEHGKWFKTPLFKVGSVPISPLGLLRVIIILIATFYVAKLARKWVSRLAPARLSPKGSSVYILSRFVRYAILLIGFIIAGVSLGFDVTIFAWIAGVITIWVGISLQAIFHNFVCGIIVLLTRTLQVRDVITLCTGETGEVTEITLRYTILIDKDGVELVVPNSEFINNRFQNRTLKNYSRRIKIPFTIDREEDTEKVRQLVVEAAQSVSTTLNQPPPKVWLLKFDGKRQNCELAVWINDTLIQQENMSPEALYYAAIDKAFKAHHVKLP